MGVATLDYLRKLYVQKTDLSPLNPATSPKVKQATIEEGEPVE